MLGWWVVYLSGNANIELIGEGSLYYQHFWIGLGRLLLRRRAMAPLVISLLAWEVRYDSLYVDGVWLTDGSPGCRCGRLESHIWSEDGTNRGRRHICLYFFRLNQTLGERELQRQGLLRLKSYVELASWDSWCLYNHFLHISLEAGRSSAPTAPGAWWPCEGSHRKSMVCIVTISYRWLCPFIGNAQALQWLFTCLYLAKKWRW